MLEPRRLLVTAARVHTLTAANPATRAADAILLVNGRIAKIGRAQELRSMAGAAQIMDFPGATLTPGLTDAHIHLTEWALLRGYADLTSARTPAEAARLLVRHADAHPATPWVRGFGWNPHHWGGTYPDRGELDHVLPDRPAALQSHDMHALWVNSAALRKADITAHTPDPADGRIVRDADGAPAGVLLEYAARLVTDRIPPPSMDDVTGALDDAQTALHALGITSVHSFPGIHVREPDSLVVLQELRARGRLRMRALHHIPLERLDDAIRLGLRSGFGDDWLRIGGVKMFLDGALGSRTAWMRAPYEGGTDRGVCTLEPGDFAHHVARAADAGIAVTVHAIGDAAVSLALDTLSAFPATALAMPHRIEHIQCCPPERLRDAGQAGIVCSVQPAHLLTDWAAADRHWGERARGAYAFRSLAAGGAVLAFGSDAPVEPVDPRRALHAALTRRGLDGQPESGWYPDECMDAAAALAAYTCGPAVAAGMADRLGLLAPGALGDVVVWDRDPLEAPLESRCLAAIVNGTVVWSDY